MDPAAGGPSRGEIALWRLLVSRALRSGVRYEDARDLASEAVRKALEAHAPDRGPFAPFCRAIHANLLKNHWRDRKPTEEFDPGTDPRESPDDPFGEIALEEGREMMRRIAEQILASLSPQEAAFFLALADAQRETERTAVTAAARRLGIRPLQGWNLFRRIQRKARVHLEEYESAADIQGMRRPSAPPTMEPMRDEWIVEGAEMPMSAPVAGRARPAAGGWLVFLAASAATAGYEQFSATLSAEQRGHLSGLVS